MQKIIKLLALIIPVVMVISLITGYIIIKDKSFLKKESAVTTYFHKGVYKTYSSNQKNPYKNYFYIFYDENSGYTEESELGIGLPFSCVQTDGLVKFRFGGVDEPEEIFKIKSMENSVITGSFMNEQDFTFVLILDANSDNFDAIEYMKKHNVD